MTHTLPRLIAALTIIGDKVVRSYGYSQRRPGVHLSTALRTLDRWQVDEIAVIDIAGMDEINPLLLATLRETPISTPLIYGGGVRSLADVSVLQRAGVDRFLLESLHAEGSDAVREIRAAVGKQALVASVPLYESSCGVCVTFGGPGSRKKSTHGRRFDQREARNLLRENFSEIWVSDRKNEGFPGGFEDRLTKWAIGMPEKTIVWFGGLDADIARALAGRPETAGLAFGNSLLVREVSAQLIRSQLNEAKLSVRWLEQ